MSNELAQMFYETDIVRFDKNSIDFSKAFAHPTVFPYLASASAEVLDDYAIDAIVSSSEVLPYLPVMSERLELPFLWLNGDQLIGDKNDVKRIIYICLVSPGVDDMKIIHDLCEQQGFEVVAVYAFLGLRPNTDKPRLLTLTSAGDLLDQYKALHLISQQEYDAILGSEEQ